MHQVYAPGCGLLIYKPQLAQKTAVFLNRADRTIPDYLTCCRSQPKLETGTRIINTCAGCDRRYRELYQGITTVSLWEILAESSSFPFPDYHGITMSIHDACPTRSEARVYSAIRTLLEKMNITVVEPKHTKAQARCCGDSFYGMLPVAQVKLMMQQRADEMPCAEVAVYCISCIKAMHIGGKKPRYIVDLLFNESTEIGTFEPEAWHRQLQEFIDTHS